MKNTRRVLSVLLAVLITLSIPISVNAVYSNVYTVTLTQDSRVKYSSVQKETFEIKENAYRSIYAKSIDKDYYIDDIDVNPAENADVSYNVKTGEVFIENVSSDITLTPVLKKNTSAEKIDVEWALAGNGNYDEENPAAYVKFKATVSDSDGNPVVNTKISLKADESDKSASTSAATDKNGVAQLKHSYGLGEHTAVITAGDVSKTVTFNVVQHKKSELELYTYQLKDSLKNTSTGSVSGLNPLYEYYTSPLHYAAIVVGSGEWKTPENGEIKNLSAGQYALRFREHTEGNTIYLHSDYNFFTIGRAEWTVKADTENSTNVSFADDELYAAPGSDVYYYVTPDKGYEISDYSVDKPSYISEIDYNAEKGYIRLGGVTGSVNLTVKAEKAAALISKASGLSSVRILALSSPVSALGASAENEGLRITDVYQNTSGSEDGKKIYFTVKGSEDFASDNLPTLYNKQSTASNYSKVSRYTVNDDGSATGYVSISDSTTAEKIYDVYASFGDEETEHVTLNVLKRPSITKTDLTVTNEKGEKKNGTITVTKADYADGKFIYNKQGSSNYLWSDTNVITGLEHGTWYVYVAPYFTKTNENEYTVQARSSSASVSVGQDEDETVFYTVKFVNAAGDTVSEKEYEEGTKASSVTIPANTADYTDGNKVYSYSWGEISDVTTDKIYNEIENVTVKKTAQLEITGVSQNDSDGNHLSFGLSLKDENGEEIEDKSGVKVYIDGNAARGNISGSEFVGNSAVSQGTHTVYATFASDEYVDAASGSITVNLTKAQKPELSQTPDINTSGKGTITITSPYSKFVYYRQGSPETVTENKVIEGLYGSDDSHVSALYYVYVPAQATEGESDYNFLIPSDKTTITVENKTEEETEPSTSEPTEPTQPSDPEPEPSKKATTTQITDIHQKETNNAEGKVIIVKVKVTDEDGNAVYEDVSGYNVTLSHTANTSGKLNSNGEIEFTIYNLKEGVTIFTAYFNGTNYESSQSASVSVNAVKAAKPELSSTPDLNSSGNGTITITSDFDVLNYYREGGNESTTSDKLLTNLSSGTYYVYVPVQTVNGNSDYNFLLASEKAKIKVEKLTAETYTVTTSDDVTLTLPEFTENGNLLYNDLVTVYKAGAKAWKVGDSIVAYGESYSFRVGGDIEIYPVADEVETNPAITIVSQTRVTSSHKVKYIANYTPVDGYRVLEYGFVYGKNVTRSDLTLENVGNQGTGTGTTDPGNVKKYIFDEYVSNQIAISYGITAQTPGDYAAVVAYVIVESYNGEKKVIYSEPSVYTYPVQL